MTAETKKKISEALKKDGGSETTTSKPQRSKEAQVLYNDFQKSRAIEGEMKNAIAQIQDEAKKLKMPPGKKNKAIAAKIKAQKEKVQAMTKTIREKIKAEHEKQKAIRQKAAEIQRVKKAQERIKKAQARIAKAELNMKKADTLEAKVKGLIGATTKPEMKARLQERLDRIVESRVRQGEAIKGAQASIKEQIGIIKTKGKVNRTSFNFAESVVFSFPKLANTASSVYLHEKKFLIWRELSLQEERADFKLLSEKFNEYEDDLSSALTAVVNEELGRTMVTVKNKLTAEDIAGIAALAVVSYSKVYSVVQDYAKRAYETGKVTASQELKVPKPTTPTTKTQLINLDADMIADAFVNEIDLIVKQKAREGLEKGVATAAIMGSIAAGVQEKASKMITNIYGNVIGENINKGRRLVFDREAARIEAFERSEVLDGRTCAMCLSLDERIVRPDDPMVKLDEVHNNCRGVWIPIVSGEEFDRNEIGIPSSIVDAFDTMGGAPTVNAFKQLKKPINEGNAEVQREIKKRLAAK